MAAIALGSVLAAAGLTLLFGALLRWPWLVDPPEADWPVYSQALFKKLLGARGVLVITYAQGYALIVAGARVLSSALS